jgi:hypothetical protein
LTKIPPAGRGGGTSSLGKSPIGGAGGKPGGGKAGVTVIPPRGGRAIGKTGGDKTSPTKGKGETK